MQLKTAGGKYDEKISAKQKSEHEISFLNNSTKDRDSKIELMQKEAIDQKSKLEDVMRTLERNLEK